MSIRSLIEINHDFAHDLDKDPGWLRRLLWGGGDRCNVHGVKLLSQRHHSDPAFAAPAPGETPWTLHKLRSRYVIRSADGGLVCVIESGAHREQIEAMVAAVNGYRFEREQSPESGSIAAQQNDPSTTKG